jgi:acyl-CoA synthetase (AMP-forming)/AMP-acid ligase II
MFSTEIDGACLEYGRVDWSKVAVWGDIARMNAVALPDKAAFVSAGWTTTFAQLNARMNRLNHALAALGLRKGDRVAILARNRTEYIEAYGVAKSGLIAVPLNWRLSVRELLHPLKDSGPAAILADPEFIPAVESLRGELKGLEHFVSFGPAQQGWFAYEALLAGATEHEPQVEVAPEDVQCLMYTSGTTGLPKGAMLTHGGLMRNCRASMERVIGYQHDDVLLAVMPFFHVGGMWYYLYAAYARGCTTAILPEFDPRAVLAALQTHRATIVHLVPTMIQRLVDEPSLREYDLSRLRTMYYAASSIPADLLKRAIGVFVHSEFLQSYGSTEAGIITVLTREQHRKAVSGVSHEHLLFSCGSVVKGAEVRILEDHGLPLGPGAVGEIAVRSERLMAGYWNNPAATQAAAPDGWLRTGDLGRVDDDGILYVVDRKNDMIVSGGENVYPFEVEDALYRDPQVLEAAVFGMPDPKWVEKVVAAVVLRPGSAATEQEILRRLRVQLAAYKCPKTIIFTDGLPRNASGKVLKKELRRRYAQPAAGARA